jgi:MFS family permease
VRLRSVVTDPGFWLLAISFTANTAAIAVVTVHLVAALIGWGHPAPFAAAVAGLFGILSVTGRLATTGLQRRYRTTSVVAAVFAVQAIAAAALPVTGRNAVAVIAAVTGFGLGFGVATIAKPVLLADRYDTRRYATIAGLLVVPTTIAKAVAPLAAAWLHAAHGYAVVFAATAATCLIAAASLTAVPALNRPQTLTRDRDPSVDLADITPNPL